MKLLKSALVSLSILASTSAFASPVLEGFEPVGKRFLTSSELFGFDLGYHTKQLLTIVEEAIKENAITPDKVTQFRDGVCGAGGLVDSLKENDSYIQNLNSSVDMYAFIQTAYKKLKIVKNVEPWSEFCAGRLNIQDMAKQARAKEKIEIAFYSAVNEAFAKYAKKYSQ